MAPSKVTPLDAERERLRAKGLTEDEISRIFIAREIGNSGPSGDATNNPITQLPMSGVLGNANAVLSHARGAIPVLKADLANLSNSTALTKSRSMSALKLAGAAAIIAVLGFVVYQEYQIYAVYAPITAAAQARQAIVDAEVKEAEKPNEIDYQHGRQLTGAEIEQYAADLGLIKLENVQIRLTKLGSQGVRCIEVLKELAGGDDVNLRKAQCRKLLLG